MASSVPANDARHKTSSSATASSKLTVDDATSAPLGAAHDVDPTAAAAPALPNAAGDPDAPCILYCPGRRTCARQVSPLPPVTLRDRNFEFVLCTSGDRAWELIQHVEFDAVVLEDDLIDLSGLDVLALLHGSSLDIPVVFTSHDPSGEIAESAVNLGAEAILFYRDGDALGTLLAKQLDRLLEKRALRAANDQLLDALRASNERLESVVEERTSELKAALQRLEAIDKLKGELIARVGYELRPSLSTVLSYAELLELSEDLDSDERRRIAKGIIGAGDRMARFADDCVELSQWYSDQHAFNLGPCQIEEIIVAAIDRARFAAIERDVQLEVTALPSARVRGDGEVLTDAFARVLDNAIKFSPAGSTVEVDLRVDPESCSVTIKDRGCGIEPEVLATLFAPDGSDREGPSGAGIGLALVRAAIDAHRGEIKIASPGAGLGTTLQVRLPARPSVALRRVDLP